jgi:hypothetical protein
MLILPQKLTRLNAHLKPLCTSVTGVIVQSASPLYVNAVYVKQIQVLAVSKNSILSCCLKVVDPPLA